MLTGWLREGRRRKVRVAGNKKGDKRKIEGKKREEEEDGLLEVKKIKLGKKIVTEERRKERRRYKGR